MPRYRDSQLRFWRFNAAGTDSDIQAVVGSFALAEAAGQTIPPVVADLVEVAGAVHVIDRSVRRPTLCTGLGSWSRNLHLELGVREPDVWNQPELHARLSDLLARLTDDSRTIQFTHRQAPSVAAECVQFLFPSKSDIDSVALFSGGVDSIVGFAIARYQGQRPMLMSAQSNRRMLAGRIEVLNALRDDAGIQSVRVGVDLHLDHAKSIESSQRARGFGFLSLGAALVEQMGVDHLMVFENGVGAINLPYSAAQAGAHGTRAMQSETLRRSAALFGLLFQRPIRVSNPNRFRTKAEMCRSVPKEVHKSLASARSCDTAYVTRLEPDSCGACTSCLHRRHALIAAGLEMVATTPVRFDALAPNAIHLPAAYPLAPC